MVARVLPLAAAPLPYSAQADGLRLAVRLTPRADRDALAGVLTGADGASLLAIRLHAPPVEGAANKALIDFLAHLLHLRRADIAIHSGDTARIKMLFLKGDPTILASRLAAVIDEASRV